MLSNTSEMGDNVLKACPSVQWSLGIIKCQNYKKNSSRRTITKLVSQLGHYKSSSPSEELYYGTCETNIKPWSSLEEGGEGSDLPKG